MDLLATLIGALFTLVLIPLVLKFLPSSKFELLGERHGEAISRKGNSIKFLSGAYEGIEKTFVGSLMAYVTGLIRGLNSDNESLTM